MFFALPYVLAFSANFLFSTSSLAYSYYAKRHSPLWMNATKIWVAFVCFLATQGVLLMFNKSSVGHITLTAFLCFASSGVFGVAVADLLLFRSFAKLGPARTLMIFNIHPIVIGILSYFLFHQTISTNQLYAILCLMACVFIISLERYRGSGSWDVKYILFAILGVVFDAFGVLLMRLGFENMPASSAVLANSIRFSTALVLYLLIFGRKMLVWRSGHASGREPLQRDFRLAALASVFGQFISLLLWGTAIKIGHLATLSAMTGLNPILTTTAECFFHKKAPSGYLWTALGVFLVAMAFLFLGNAQH